MTTPTAGNEPARSEPVTFDTLNRGALLASHYREEHERLLADPIIQDMAAEIPAGVDLDGGGFMRAASDTYHDRGGTNARSIGGPADAIRVLHDRRHRNGPRPTPTDGPTRPATPVQPHLVPRSVPPAATPPNDLIR